MTSAASTTTPPALPAYNRLGIDYRNVPPRKFSGRIIDCHTHCRNVEQTRTILDAADAYGIDRIWTMTPLEDVAALNAAYPGRFEYIAVPKWQEGAATEAFITAWMKRLDDFYALGARLVKFHQAPGTIKRWGMKLDHPLMQRVIQHAYQLGYHFMTHIADPKAWFADEKRYGKPDEFGTFESQFAQLEELLARFPDRIHLGAHMGGSLEDLDRLAARLEKFPNYCIDMSATKWMVRAVAEQDPQRVRAFCIRFQDRILWGSDLVVGDQLPWEHYASRYWTHLKLWESDYSGPSPIADPDAAGADPQLHGVNLPTDVLEKVYRANALRWLPRAGLEPAALRR